MSYTLALHTGEEVSDAQRRQAEQRFRCVLEEALGSSDLVGPMFLAYQQIVAVYGEAPDEDVLTAAERMVFDQWQAAEMAAITAAFGPHRYIDEARFEFTIAPAV